MNLNAEEVDTIVSKALNEDIGAGDITSKLVIPEDAQAEMVFVTREDIVVCGIPVLKRLYDKLESRVEVTELCKEGDHIVGGTEILRVKGFARELLSTERVALNLLQRMCGIATLTSKYVDAVKGTNVKILDTRKTTPCIREIEKYAVYIGGGTNHRMRLDDGILIKDNHISIAGGVAVAVKKAKDGNQTGLKIEVECDTIEQVGEAIEAGADIILLDNMDTDTLREAVKLASGKVLLEASGGVTLETVRQIAETGVDFISVGALTHSAPAVDIGLDIA